MYPRPLTLMMLLLVGVLVACDAAPSANSADPTLGDQPIQPVRQPAQVVQPVTANDLQIVTGQRVYVPAYSQVLLNPNGASLELAVTLAIHNTNEDAALVIRQVRYYNTEGDLVRDYITEPVSLPPLATTGYIVASEDQSGGWGANFIVEWSAPQPVYEPVIEAVMVSTRGTQGVSLVSPGRVLSQTRPDDPSAP